MTSPPPKHHHKIYRIALYGRSASGKSCLLAALAMPRAPNPNGLHCTWIPVDVPPGDTSPHAEQLRTGKTWMQAALRMLSNGELLPPTPVDTHLSVRYDFTTPDHRTFQVELVDYSGELVHAETSDSELAKRLRKQFSEMDGIIVLAEAPYRNQLKGREGDPFRDLNNLRQTFTLLRGEKQEGAALDVPVALAITKWDHWIRLEGHENPATEQAALQAFFTANPAHGSLHAVLQSSVTSGNFQVFPVSALGPNRWVCDEENIVLEVPIQSEPLAAFGMEEPFAWLVERRDSLDLIRFRQEAQNKLSVCQSAGKDLLKRFPPHSPTAREVHGILGECRRKQMKYSAIALASVVALWFVAETSLDMYKYRKYSAITENPKAGEEELFAAEQWFSGYSLAPGFRHLISRLKLSREEAHKIAYSIQMAGQDAAWKIIENAATPAAKRDAARGYLKKYPYGPHAADAQILITQVDAQEEDAGYRQGWEAIQNQVGEAGNDPDKLEELLERLSGLEGQYPAAALQYREERQSLQTRLSGRRAELLSLADKKEFTENLQKVMAAGDWESAASQLTARPGAEPWFEELKEELRRQAPRKIAEKVKQQLAESKFNEARGTLEIYNRIPAYFKDSGGDETIAEARKQYEAGLDENLYNEFKKNPNAATIKAYLETAPLRSMREDVEEYKAYLADIDPNADLKRLQLRLVTITWRADDANQELTVMLDGNSYITIGGLNAVKDAVERVQQTGYYFEAKPGENLAIKVQIKGTDWVLNDLDSAGSFNATPKILAEKGWNFILSNDKGPVAELAFGLDGYPEAPSLPAWRLSK